MPLLDRRPRPIVSLVDDQLRALVAIVDEGSFDAAAYVLGVSPSAISQRVKALEARIGQVVVRRATPCTPTEAGAVLVRAARQMELVEAEAATGLTGAAGAHRLAVTVNADSLATWFRPVLAAAASWEGSVLSLAVDDQDHSAQHLRGGDVIGAVTSLADPVAGCRSEPLGVMRYLPLAAPALLDRHDGELARLPVVRFNAKDDLQHALLRRQGINPSAVTTHLVPSSEAFVEAIRAGLGWGMVPELQLGDDLATRRLTPVVHGEHADVVLHWQAWRLASARLDALADAVRTAAAALRPLSPGAAPSSTRP